MASPWIIYQLWQFVAAGLFPRERKIVYRYTAPSALPAFCCERRIFLFLVLPMSLNFFMTFSAHTARRASPRPTGLERMIGLGRTIPPQSPPSTAAATPARPPLRIRHSACVRASAADPPVTAQTGSSTSTSIRAPAASSCATASESRYLLDSEPGSLFNNMWRYDDYLSLVMFTSLVFGVAFELPMVILILAQTGIVETKSFRSARKYAYFIIVIVAAIAAPSGDLMNLTCLSVPLLALYELGILAADIMVRPSEAETT